MKRRVSTETEARAAPAAGAGDAVPGYVDRTLWSRLADAPSPEAFAAAWLEIQCRLIDGAERGVVVLGPADRGPYAPVAYWPPESGVSAQLSAVAELAMAERKGSLRAGPPPDGSNASVRDVLAYPLLVDNQLHGVVALEVRHRDEGELRALMRQLQWGCGWLEALVRRHSFTSKDRLVGILELVAVCLENERFKAAATAVVTELVRLLSGESVSIGFLRGRRIRVDALSHSASFGEKTNLIRGMAAAMEEAVDQQAVVLFPPPPDGPPVSVHAHAELARQAGDAAICTVPLSDGERLLGGLTLLRAAGHALDPKEVELCRHIASLVGPVLDLKRREDRWLGQKAWDSWRTFLDRLFGPRHAGLKLAAILGLGLVAFLGLARGEYRVSADALLEGTVQRAVTAPFDGYIAEAAVRAGDVVKEGDLLCALDDKDLVLERVKWVSQREQHLRAYSKALADGDRAQVRILGAQVDQAETQIALLDEQLSRTRIVAPFGGVVVTGDLSQQLSAPVERGQVLFEVAPLDSYRVILKVDERDIGDVAAGQSGQLVLAGMPNRPLDMAVERITPVSVTEEGRNYFRTEARLGEVPPLLRPGMEGVGKVSIGERRLIWIWGHELLHWVRLWLWSWWP